VTETTRDRGRERGPVPIRLQGQHLSLQLPILPRRYFD
jgi:hypothetical protein